VSGKTGEIYYFFEDPIEPENMDQWEYVAANVPMPLAMGERLYTIYQFLDLLNHRGAAFVRPDLSLAGGISHIKKIAAIAEAHYVGVAPPQPTLRRTHRRLHPTRRRNPQHRSTGVPPQTTPPASKPT
tara:strand:+ start:22 stop:405 length:384 start_codon:yes stop_codon:yes gene_type:complete